MGIVLIFPTCPAALALYENDRIGKRQGLNRIPARDIMKAEVDKRCKAMHLSPAAAYVLDTLNNSGYKAWLVGGCVRDSLRGVMPNDFDMATTALPQQVMSCFPEFHVVPTGIRHGTVTVVADGGFLEITTLRADGCYGDGRRPDEVTFVKDIRLDLSRRDFTVNAMAWSTIDGLIDPFGGQADLEKKLLRCVGDPTARLREDSLRVMRCLRFAACLGFRIDPPTAAALYSERGGLARVAAERLNHELKLLICGSFAGAVIAEYRDILTVIIPEIIPYVDQKLLASAGDDCSARLAILLGGAAPAEILRRLRFDNDIIRKTAALCRLMNQPRPCSLREAAKLIAKADGGRYLTEFVNILGALSETVPCEEAESMRTAEKYIRQVLCGGCTSVEELRIDGNILIDMGMQASERLGTVLGQLTEAVMAGDCPNEPRALTKLARQLYRNEKT